MKVLFCISVMPPIARRVVRIKTCFLVDEAGTPLQCQTEVTRHIVGYLQDDGWLKFPDRAFWLNTWVDLPDGGREYWTAEFKVANAVAETARSTAGDED